MPTKPRTPLLVTLIWLAVMAITATFSNQLDGISELVAAIILAVTPTVTRYFVCLPTGADPSYRAGAETDDLTKNAFIVRLDTLGMALLIGIFLQTGSVISIGAGLVAYTVIHAIYGTYLAQLGRDQPEPNCNPDAGPAG